VGVAAAALLRKMFSSNSNHGSSGGLLSDLLGGKSVSWTFLLVVRPATAADVVVAWMCTES
jgi:hypothetical protein